MRFAPYRAAADEYLRRIKHYMPLQEVELKSELSPKLSELQIREKESRQIMAQVAQGSHLFVLDERGKLMSSTQFAQVIEGLMGSRSPWRLPSVGRLGITMYCASVRISCLAFRR